MFRVKYLIIFGFYREIRSMPSSINPFRTSRLLSAMMVSGLAMSSTRTAAELIQYDQSGITSSYLFPNEAFSASIVIDTDTLTLERSNLEQPETVYYRNLVEFTGNIVSFVITIGNDEAEIAGSGGEFTFYALERGASFGGETLSSIDYNFSQYTGAIYTVNTLGFDPTWASLSGFFHGYTGI